MTTQTATERVVLFGAHGGLVGVVTEPTGSAPAAPRAVVVSNIGHHHRVGPYRLYVELGRRLARAGWHTLRFDLSGHGDSASRAGALSDDETAALDVREAIDWLSTRYGVRDVVLLGLCSGVMSTHTVAVSDPRVTGAVFIDGFSYPTVGFHIRASTLRYLQPARWFRYARRRLFELTLEGNNAPTADARSVAPIFVREIPPREQFRADVGRMVARGTRLLFVFTGTTYHRYNGRVQLFEMLGPLDSRDAVQVAFLTGADHLFTSLDHRAEFFDLVEHWLQSFDVGGSHPGDPAHLLASATG